MRTPPEPGVIPAWLRNLVLAGLVLFVLVDLAGPVVVRVQLDQTANDAAVVGGRTYLRGGGAPGAELAARGEVEAEGATLDHFEVLRDGRVAVTVTKHVESRLFDRLEQLDSWYDVQVDATSSGSTL